MPNAWPKMPAADAMQPEVAGLWQAMSSRARNSCGMNSWGSRAMSKAQTAAMSDRDPNS